MKQSVLYFLIALIFTACLSPSGDQPAPPAQTFEASTTPTPTPTPIPTPTIHPQVIAIQEKIAASGETFTLNADGQIEMQTDEGMTIVPDIQVQPDGTMTFTHNGEEFTANTETLEINGQTIRFQDTEGKTWVFDGENLKEEIREFVPANTIILEKEGGVPQSLRLNENADLKSVYEDMTIWFMGNYTGLPENQELKERINKLIEENPEQYGKFAGIGNSADHALRVEFMQFVLKESGGLLTIKNHKNDKMEVNFNLPPAIVIEKVNEVDHRFEETQSIAGPADNRTGMGVLVDISETGKLQIRIQYVGEMLKHERQPFVGYGLAQYASRAIRRYVARNYFGNNDSTRFDINLYMYSPRNPADADYYQQAIKHKNRFILVNN